MIDLEKKFKRYEKEIKEYVSSRKEGYYDSDCFKKLKSRVERINNSLDMRFASPNSRNNIQNSWKSKIAMPLMLEADINLKALLLSNFSNPPMVSLNPIDDTPYENARNMEDMLESNFKTTKFRPKAFNFSRLYASHYGTAVIVSQPIEEIGNTMATRNTLLGYERVIIPKIKRNVVNSAIHPLNYFQNPSVADPEVSDFQGFMDRYFLADLMALYKENPEFYVKENIEHIFKQAEKEAITDRRSYGGTGAGDKKERCVDIAKYYGTVNIKDNEDSLVEYECWMVADKVIRFLANPYDWAIRPISVATLAPRLEYWWGNTPIEYQSPYENFGTLFMQMAADEAMRRIENYIFYERGSIDVADWNNRFKMGGLIPVDLKNKQLPHMLWNYQRPDVSLQGTQYMLQEMKEAAQRVGIKTDLRRSGLKGGPQNETATAAMMLEAQGNIVANDVLKQFSMGLSTVGRINAILLQQYSLEEFSIRPKPKEPRRILKRADIMGEFEYECETSLTKNQLSESTRLQNVITGLLNFKGTGDAVFANINPIITKTLKEWIRKLDLPSIDLDVDLQEPQAALPMLPPPMQGNLPGGLGMPPQALEAAPRPQPQMMGAA